MEKKKETYPIATLCELKDNKVCQIKKKCEGKYLQFADMDVDHIIPHSKGGKTIVSNGRVSCPECNRSKGAN
jgi:5-methylcytosine-specific restriction endonuclease McrA